MGLLAWKELIVRGIEVAGVIIILIGAALATGRFIYFWPRIGFEIAYRELRQHLGLEFLVAGDIINTVAVDPSFRSVGVLAGIVVIRTFLSFSLEVEIEGRWPWDKRKGEKERSSRDTA
jgi:uncharacterized membrane protein